MDSEFSSVQSLNSIFISNNRFESQVGYEENYIATTKLNFFEKRIPKYFLPGRIFADP